MASCVLGPPEVVWWFYPPRRLHGVAGPFAFVVDPWGSLWRSNARRDYRVMVVLVIRILE